MKGVIGLILQSTESRCWWQFLLNGVNSSILTLSCCFESVVSFLPFDYFFVFFAIDFVG